MCFIMYYFCISCVKYTTFDFHACPHDTTITHRGRVVRYCREKRTLGILSANGQGQVSNELVPVSFVDGPQGRRPVYCHLGRQLTSICSNCTYFAQYRSPEERDAIRAKCGQLFELKWKNDTNAFPVDRKYLGSYRRYDGRVFSLGQGTAVTAFLTARQEDDLFENLQWPTTTRDDRPAEAPGYDERMSLAFDSWKFIRDDERLSKFPLDVQIGVSKAMADKMARSRLATNRTSTRNRTNNRTTSTTPATAAATSTNGTTAPPPDLPPDTSNQTDLFAAHHDVTVPAVEANTGAGEDTNVIPGQDYMHQDPQVSTITWQSPEERRLFSALTANGFGIPTHSVADTQNEHGIGRSSDWTLSNPAIAVIPGAASNPEAGPSSAHLTPVPDVGERNDDPIANNTSKWVGDEIPDTAQQVNETQSELRFDDYYNPDGNSAQLYTEEYVLDRYRPASEVEQEESWYL